MPNSWGNFPKVSHDRVIELAWRDQHISFDEGKCFLPYGQGRSYGDSCLNEDGILLSTKGLNKLISFDKAQGIIECESGVTLADLLEFVVPYGWFLPVLPGTKFVSVGGAIANDVHGKNHHSAGTFGCHVLGLDLLRSSGEKVVCTADVNSDLYRATIGGLGLTGVILSAKIKLKPISSAFLSVEQISFQNLKEFFSLCHDSEKNYEYTVAWLDCVADGRNFGRGIFMRANHLQDSTPPALSFSQRQESIRAGSRLRGNKRVLKVPFNVPSVFLNRWTIKAFNELYFNWQSTRASATVFFEKFFFPLDAIAHWNRLYGKNGFLQYQCVLPQKNAEKVEHLLRKIVSSGQGSFLSVLKTFGSIGSPGLMSFPEAGVTLALDFPCRGSKTFHLLNSLDEMVMEYGGKVYPAKDANMREQAFKTYFPHWEAFSQWIDPKFSSSLWRRVAR